MEEVSNNWKTHPSPIFDFEPHEKGLMPGEVGIANKALRFGFESPQHAKNWFPPHIMDQLGDYGFKLQPVKAKKVYRSKSGTQVMFEPHSSETKLAIAKSDWPMSQKEELDPAKTVPGPKILDKGVMPEHVKSVKAHHKLVPGEILDSRHVVVQNASGKNAVREVSAGMQRDLNDTTSNPTGPGQGNPTSARNKPSRT